MAKSGLMKKVLFLASVTGSLAAVNYFINNENNKKIGLITNKKENVQRLNYNWKYGKISYKKCGEGSPIILIHELDCGASNIEWDKLYEGLCENHCVYMIDLLGCGLSDKPYITYTNYLYVQLITDFINDIVQNNADIIASGNSSAIAAMSLLNQSDIINKIVMINPSTALLDNPNVIERKKIYEYVVGIPVIGTTVYNYFYNKENSRKKSVDKFVDYENKEAYDESSYVNSHYDSSKSKYLFASMEKNLTDISIKRAIENADDKVMILCGEYNPDKDDIEKCYQYHNEKISTKIISNSNAYPHIENAEETIKTIKDFL